ncbi:MAG: hypothetical protein ACLQJR_21940 [Stellaceae bacterium]
MRPGDVLVLELVEQHGAFIVAAALLDRFGRAMAIVDSCVYQCSVTPSALAWSIQRRPPQPASASTAACHTLLIGGFAAVAPVR